MSIQYLHTMVRVSDIDASLKFFCDGLGLTEVSRMDSERMGGMPDGVSPTQTDIPMVELTYNWDPEDYAGGRNFGHLAYMVDDIYGAVERLQKIGVTINRPPRDGRMAFIRSPDGISVELLQKGEPLSPKEPWASAENIGAW